MVNKMSVYLLILLLSICGVFVKKGHIRKSIYYITLCISFLILIFRNVGTDYFLYKGIYDNIESFSSDRFEITIRLLMIFVKSIFNNYVYLCLILGFITFFNFIRTIKSNSKYVTLSLFIFLTLGFYTKSFNIMKQMVAVSFIFSSLPYINKRDFKKFFLNVFLGSLFHSSALIFIPVYFVTLIKKEKILLYLIIIITVIIFSNYNNFIQLLNYSDQYSVYVTYTTGIEVGIATYLTIIMYLVMIMIIYLNRVKLKEEKLIMVIILSIPFLIASTFNNLFMRISLYFLSPLILLIPNYIETLSGKKKTIISVSFILLSSIFYILNVLLFGGIYPYESIF